MKNDFSIEGRENFLSQVYFDTHGKFVNNEIIFARWTLLQRVIWKFKPAGAYCHLDGFDFDILHHYRNGFIGIGRVRLLESNKSGGQVYTTMAIEFDEDNYAVKNGKFWVCRMPVIKGNAPPNIDIPPLQTLFLKTKNFSHDWQFALSREPSGWILNRSFDLSVFLNKH